MSYHYPCKWCNNAPKPGYAKSDKLRVHINKFHPEIDKLEYERFIVQTRYPDLDIDATVKRYTDKLETAYTLDRKGLRFKHYLRVIGVLRKTTADLVLGGRYLVPFNPQTVEELNKLINDSLMIKFINASPEVRYRGYLNRDIAILKNKGHEDLVPAVTLLKTIKFVKKQIAKSLSDKAEAGKTEVPDSPEKPLETVSLDLDSPIDV